MRRIGFRAHEHVLDSFDLLAVLRAVFRHEMCRRAICERRPAALHRQPELSISRTEL
jgi:hypothetical protein